ncbi:hypothetical protein SAMN05720470_1174 [Fibrobacter sp. UWOV1]|uniref:hypothetical protein n=1 Tax=Fibrobacter sp. UWOV1 TaxID=1896215 RepID=UPI00092262B6|nr:hypothetical protein [Fibrobacter sp. UWOV1]SHL79599.1 hypothetical protein SAMN05720470_1174 [Fibrobacter sp. UWOV1]
MNKKTFKTGDIITPEFLNALQNPSFEKGEEEVGHLPTPEGIEYLGKARVNEEDSNPRFLAQIFNQATHPAYRIGNLVFTVKETRGGLMFAGDVISGWEPMGVGEATTLNCNSDKDYNIYFSGSGYTVTIESPFLAGLNGAEGNHLAILHNRSIGEITIKMKCSANGNTWYDEIDLPEGVSFLHYISGDGFGVYRLQSFSAAIEDALNQATVTFLAKTGGNINGSLFISQTLNVNKIFTDYLSVSRINRNIAIPDTLTTNDLQDTLGKYLTHYEPKSLDVFRIPDHYSHQGGDVGMSTDFYLTEYTPTTGDELIVHNVGNDDLTIHWTGYGGTQSATISPGYSKKFVAISTTLWNAMA